MSEYKGNNGPGRSEKSTYTPEVREQYRERYYGRSETPRQPSSAGARQPSGTARPAQGGARMPYGSSNGTRYAGYNAQQGGAQRQGAPSARPAARPAQGNAPRPAQQRPGYAQSRPAPRPGQGYTRKKQGFFASLVGGNGPQYGRMLLLACVVVLVVFGLVKGIGAIIDSNREPDYIVATKITPAPTEDPAAVAAMAQNVQPTQEPVYEAPAQPTQAPVVEQTPEPVSDEGYFPESGEAPAAPTQPQEYAPSGTGRTARLRFAGDIVADTEILATAYNSKTDKYDFSSYFDMIRDQLSNADFTSLNVDGSMGGEEHYRYGYSGYPQFNTPPTMLYALLDAGVDMLTLANNHCLDGWFNGLLATIENCDYVGMQHVGAFSSQEDYDTPEILDINGIKVGFLNYTQSLNSMDKAGVDERALIYGIRRTAGADYEGDIQDLRDAGAEVVIVVMHWGGEYLFSPDQDQVSMANRIAAAGADVIVGGHPHVFQAAGWKSTTLADGTPHDCLLVYSLGNFLSEHRNEKKARTDAGIIFEFTLQENLATGEIDVVAPAYLPIAVWRVGSEGAYDYRVVSVDAVLENRPAGMSDSAFARIKQISKEMDEVYGKSNFTRLTY
ncbi:MAG: CapA family protein [Eubacteriales bacterium]|nr:CapA family protein [Eubacteriales bacterium]